MAIDSYCLLHKGAVPVAETLLLGEDQQVYVKYCMKYVNMFKSFNIKPIMVFDGNHLPAKSLTESKRKELKLIARQKAQASFRMGNPEEARSYLKQCIDITPQMAFNLIDECRKNGVDCIVAPYESDSQLAYLNIKGFADVVVTEDSDLIMFGCTKVLYKLDLQGNGRLVEKEKLPLSLKINPTNYTFDKFRIMCILSGCDYIDSLPGVGLKKALKFISMTAEDDPLKFLDKIPRYLNLKRAVVTPEYKTNFMLALATVKHQIVFDPFLRKLVRLTEPGTHGTKMEYCKNAGEFFDNKTAYQIALGNLNPFTLDAFGDWDPEKSQNNLSTIWNKKYLKELASPKYKTTNNVDVKSVGTESSQEEGVKRKREGVMKNGNIKKFFKEMEPKDKLSESLGNVEENLVNYYNKLPQNDKPSPEVKLTRSKVKIEANKNAVDVENPFSIQKANSPKKDSKNIVASRYFAAKPNSTSTTNTKLNSTNTKNDENDDVDSSDGNVKSPILNSKTQKMRLKSLRPSLDRLRRYSFKEGSQKENES